MTSGLVFLYLVVVDVLIGDFTLLCLTAVDVLYCRILLAVTYCALVSFLYADEAFVFEEWIFDISNILYDITKDFKNISSLIVEYF